MPAHLPQRGGTAQGERTSQMVELIRTNDVVLIGFVQSLLESERVPNLLADTHVSVLEGSIGAFPRRLLVPTDWNAKARRILVEAGLGAELRDG